MNTLRLIYLKSIDTYNKIVTDRCLDLEDILTRFFLWGTLINVVDPKTMIFKIFVCAFVQANLGIGLTDLNAVFTIGFWQASVNIQVVLLQSVHK